MYILNIIVRDPYQRFVFDSYNILNKRDGSVKYNVYVCLSLLDNKALCKETTLVKHLVSGLKSKGVVGELRDGLNDVVLN